MTNKHDVIEFLRKNGVETRFVSIINERVYVNNLKLSRFSRTKEELFLEKFPYYEVKRSKVFQKICTRSSRVLKNALNPRDKILVVDSGDCVNLAMCTVLEPYTRKYGIEFVTLTDEMGDNGLKSWVNNYQLPAKQADAIALPLTLDDEVEHILEVMLHGDKLELFSSQTGEKGLKTIYPLINVPLSWIEAWREIDGLNCLLKESEGRPRHMLEFLEGFIPDVREKMIRSAFYLSEEEFND